MLGGFLSYTYSSHREKISTVFPPSWCHTELWRSNSGQHMWCLTTEVQFYFLLSNVFRICTAKRHIKRDTEHFLMISNKRCSLSNLRARKFTFFVNLFLNVIYYKRIFIRNLNLVTNSKHKHHFCRTVSLDDSNINKFRESGVTSRCLALPLVPSGIAAPGNTFCWQRIEFAPSIKCSSSQIAEWN